jgi:hypothetical protein
VILDEAAEDVMGPNYALRGWLGVAVLLAFAVAVVEELDREAKSG